MLSNRISVYFADEVANPQQLPDATGFVSIPVQPFRGALETDGNSLGQALQKLYQQALESARQQAAAIPRNRIAGFWKQQRGA